MDLTASAGDKAVSMAWLGDAIEYARSHGQTEALAYLEAIMEDVVFETEMVATRDPFTVG